MCISPTNLPNGQLVACRKCWQCEERIIDDWVGRCIAEKKSSRKAHSVTLTYGRDENGSPDHLRAAVLTYSDVQTYIKLLRKHGYPCRYFAVGEYGSKKQRTHWHLLIFWQENHPPLEKLGARIIEEHWPHGKSFYENVYPETIRYVCKYILKDKGTYQSHLAMSKKPPLGHDHFMKLAARYVKQGIAPQNLAYSFGDVIKHGRKKKFMMSGKTATNFLREFVALWKKHRPDQHIPESELVEDYIDRESEAFDWEPIGNPGPYDRERQRKMREADFEAYQKGKENGEQL